MAYCCLGSGSAVTSPPLSTTGAVLLGSETPGLEDLSLPRIILVESTWIHGLHGHSGMDSTSHFFWQERHSNLGFSPWTVHRILMNLFNFHGIHTDSPRIPHRLSPWSVHG